MSVDNLTAVTGFGLTGLLANQVYNNYSCKLLPLQIEVDKLKQNKMLFEHCKDFEFLPSEAERLEKALPELNLAKSMRNLVVAKIAFVGLVATILLSLIVGANSK